MRNLTLACLFAIVRAQAEGDENTVTVTTQNDEILIPGATKEEANLAVSETTFAEVEPENRTTESAEDTAAENGAPGGTDTSTAETDTTVETETDSASVKDEEVDESAENGASEEPESEAVDSTEGGAESTKSSESNAVEEVDDDSGANDDQAVDAGAEENSTGTTDD